MIAVLDTSAAVELVLNGARAGSVAAFLTNVESVLAPELFVAEACNVFWKYYHFQNVPAPVCEMGLSKCLELVNEFVPGSNLQAEAFALACLTSMTAYDMFYLALARRHNATLLTLDKDLADCAKKQGVKVKYIN